MVGFDVKLMKVNGKFKNDKESLDNVEVQRIKPRVDGIMRSKNSEKTNGILTIHYFVPLTRNVF